MGCEVNVWAIIEQVLRNPAIRAERESSSLHCSSAGISLQIDGRTIREGGCRRAQFFRYHRYPKDEVGTNVESMTKMGFGSFAEALIAEPMKIGGIFLGTQVPVSIVRSTQSGLQYKINGYMDFMIRDPKTGRPEICELKTTGVFGEKGVIEATKDNPLVPKIEHVLQVVPYIDWLTMPNQGVPIEHAKCNIMYLSREGNKSQHVVQLHPTEKHVIISNDAGVLQWTHITPEAIYRDFDVLAEQIGKGPGIENAPPPDYQIKWDRDTVIWKAEHGELNKKNTDLVNQKIRAGEVGPLLDMGDWNCAWCDYARGCWNPSPSFAPVPLDFIGSIVAESQALAARAPQRVAIAPLPGA